jgi:hypothetical protein
LYKLAAATLGDFLHFHATAAALGGSSGLAAATAVAYGGSSNKICEFYIYTCEFMVAVAAKC